MNERVSGISKGAPAVDTQAGTMSLALQMFSRRWLLATLLVFVAMGVMVRLGIWQLDRLEQRRAFNARVSAQLEQPTLELTSATIDLDLSAMEYRTAMVRGTYDHTQQVALRNQVWENQLGVHLLTPLKIEGTDEYVLVNRGWVPVEDFQSYDWSAYDEPGVVEVQGMIRASQSQPDFGRRSDPTPAPGEGPLKVWYFANISRIAEQVPGSLLPVYVQQAPDSTWMELPHRTLPKLELTEGPHMGYALQWFSFAVILGVGYPIFIRRRTKQGRQ